MVMRGDLPVREMICCNLFGDEQEFRYFYGSIRSTYERS